MKKGYSYSSKNKNGRRLCIKDQKGVTLVEVMIAFLVLVIISLIMIQGIMIATRAAEINKAKTTAMAIASNEIEEIRLRNYGEIGIEGASEEEPQGDIEAETIIDGYTVSRTITWAEGESSYKQVEISVINDKMNEEVTMVTQMYGGKFIAGHPPITNLNITCTLEIFGFFINVQLTWDAPLADTPVDYYEIYRDGVLDDTSFNTSYTYDVVFGYHEYYVVVLYQDGERSIPSETISTGDL